MGVPSLYKWIIQKFPEIRTKLNERKEILVDNLYLDFNAIIHPCCDKSLNSSEETDRVLYQNLSKFLDDVISKVKPRELLYIAIDGVAPRAKLNQQRARRFVSAREDDIQNKVYFEDPQECPSKSFNINSITPGTEFMERLNKYLEDLIAYKISTDPIWRHLNVIYSNYKVPGEGEQKILEYIRKHQKQELQSVIYSPDADLIFLGLTLHNHKIKIMREEPKIGAENSHSWDDHVFVDINYLRRLLISDFKGILKRDFNYRRFLDDWVLLCFSVGNDFLPSSPAFEIRTSALNKLTNILKIVYLKTNSYITNNGKINFQNLHIFFRECSLREDQYIDEKRANVFTTRQRMGTKVDTDMEFSISHESGKIRFYIEKMGIKSESDLIDICKEYIKGCEWVYNYYFFDNISWDWYYPNHFAPFFADLAVVVLKGASTFGPNQTKPLTPFEQLMSVLPPKSKDLLPAPLHGIFDKHKEMYPMNFEIDMFQKCMDWQAIPILPFVDRKNVVSFFRENQCNLSFDDSIRNITNYPLLFSRDPNIITKAYNLYANSAISEMIQFHGSLLKIFPVNNIRFIDDMVQTEHFSFQNQVFKVSFDQRKVFTKSK